MTDKQYTRKSKFLSLVLRHKPEEIGITLDKHGWADVKDILRGVGLTSEELKHIVDTDEKMRYSFNEDGTKIRANQGHSVNVDVELTEMVPPNTLYHGTAIKFINSIMEYGLIKGSRQYVHLSKDVKTAIKVGKRHGDPVVLMVDCAAMAEDGYKFYLSANGVWLTNSVPVKYIKEQIFNNSTKS